MIPPLRLYRSQGADRVAVLSTEPAYAQAGSFLIRVARGNQGSTYGPFPADQLEARFAELVAQLGVEGYQRAGVGTAIAELGHASTRKRGLAALKLGRQRAREAVPALLAALDKATDEACSILDALGAIGDPRAIPAARGYAARKLLSRRRSGVEALRRLGDAEGLAEARLRAIEGLEKPVSEALAAPKLDLTTSAQATSFAESAPEVQALVNAVLALPAKHHGHETDALYEIGLPLTTTAARVLLGKLNLTKAHVWRYAKSILKRALLRHDHATIGWLTHAIEVRAREERGSTANVKSGRDGVSRDTKIFFPKTQRWVLRSVWRELRYWARWSPSDYTKAAAEALIPYTAVDAKPGKGSYGPYSRCYLLNRILWGKSPRLEYLDRTLRFRVKTGHSAIPTGKREESFPELWDAHPLPLLRVLAYAKLPEVQAFAATAVSERHASLMKEATSDELFAMLGQTHAPTVDLGAAELETRFDPADPDLDLLDKLLRDERERVRQVGQAWLEPGAAAWTADTGRSLAWLTVADGTTRERVADVLVASLPSRPKETRTALAGGLLGLLCGPESVEGLHAAASRVASDALADELSALLTVDTLRELIEKGSSSAKSLAGALLGRRPEALQTLGLGRILGYAQHEVISVRRAAQRLVQGAVPALRSEPGLLFLLVESEWPDTREVAVAILRDHLDLATLGVDGLIGLCDSTRKEVQDLGRALVLRHFKELDPREVMERLAEHPHPNMRRFALELVEKHLPEGAPALARLARFFSVVLLDVSPDRVAKRRVLDLLVARGKQDPEQAKVAVSVLSSITGTRTKSDLERVLAALTELRVAFPEVASPVEVTS